MAFRFLSLAALVATTALAKTDLEGCTYYDDVVTVTGRNDIPPYATRIWYVPDTNELCEFLDCGGGRAPPKTNVPGCGNYKGTDTYSPRFLPSSTSSSAAAEETVTPSRSGAQTTPAPTQSGAADESGAAGESGAADEASGTEEDGGAKETDGAGSGAAAMGVSVMGGLAVVGAGAWGLF